MKSLKRAPSIRDVNTASSGPVGGLEEQDLVRSPAGGRQEQNLVRSPAGGLEEQNLVRSPAGDRGEVRVCCAATHTYELTHVQTHTHT
jgi:hypothetical protein